MSTQLSHRDQYKMLREEIMLYASEIYRTEVYGSIAVGSIYTWLLLHKNDITTRPVWFIAPCLIFVCAIRCLIFIVRIKSIAGYLMRIEEIVFKQEDKLLGWERYKHCIRWIDITDNIIAILAWTLAFTGSIVFSWILSR